MPFEVGRKKTGGRVKGTKDKRVLNYQAVLEKHNFCPASALIECYLEAKKIYDSYGVIYDAIAQNRENLGLVPKEDNAHKYLKIASDNAQDLASYAYPKLKAIEMNRESPWKTMTPQEKIQMTEKLLVQLKESLHENQEP